MSTQQNPRSLPTSDTAGRDANGRFAKGNSGGPTFDTSGIDPSADLTISGNVTLAGGWGINVGAGGKAQATTQASQKIYSMIVACAFSGKVALMRAGWVSGEWKSQYG